MNKPQVYAPLPVSALAAAGTPGALHRAHRTGVVAGLAAALWVNPRAGAAEIRWTRVHVT